MNTSNQQIQCFLEIVLTTYLVHVQTSNQKIYYMLVFVCKVITHLLFDLNNC